MIFLEKYIKSRDYKYIYICSKNEELIKVLKKYFNNVDDIKEKVIYEIKYNDEKNMTLIEQAYIDEKIDE